MAFETTKLERWVCFRVWGLGFGEEEGRMGNNKEFDEVVVLGLWSVESDEGVTLGNKFVMVAIDDGVKKVT